MSLLEAAADINKFVDFRPPGRRQLHHRLTILSHFQVFWRTLTLHWTNVPPRALEKKKIYFFVELQVQAVHSIKSVFPLCFRWPCRL